MVTCHLWCTTRLSTWSSSFSIIYNDDLSSLVIVSHSTVKLFTDDVTIYKKIVCAADVALLQHDLSSIIQWLKLGYCILTLTSVKVLRFQISLLHLFHVIVYEH